MLYLVYYFIGQTDSKENLIMHEIAVTFSIYHILFQNEGHTITISRESWENLMSRVLLLETKLELSNRQVGQVHMQ